MTHKESVGKLKLGQADHGAIRTNSTRPRKMKTEWTDPSQILLNIEIIFNSHHAQSNTFCIVNGFYMKQNIFGPSNEYMIQGFMGIVTMVAGRAQYCHLVVTCFVALTIAETIISAQLFSIGEHRTYRC